MKIRKYGYAFLIIFLIISTIFLSVKHEQKRLSEKMALQEEKEKFNTESAALIWQENSDSDKEDETIKETILVKDKYFKVIEIIDAEEWKYVYTIYNADGREVRKEESYRDPGIHYIDQETIEISISAGSYVNYCTYYDITNDRFSEQYESPITADYHRVALLPYKDGERPLIIKDMFDEGNCYQEFSLDFADAIWPVVSAEFQDENTLLITYNSGESYHYKEKTKLLYWGDSESRTEDEEEIPVCDIVRAMDFTAKEPQLDITPEENQIYLEWYLKVLKNEIPTIDETGEQYYKDLWRAGTEFEQLLKEKDTREYPYLYYYDDLDGDGKPEFAINQGCMFLFKYDKELDQCIILDQEQSCYFESIVGVGQIWCHDGLHANTVRDDLISLVEDRSFQYILRLDEGVTPNHHYYQIGVSEALTYDVYYVDVSEEEWNEITSPFLKW